MDFGYDLNSDFTSYNFSHEDLDKIDDLLVDHLVKAGVHSVLMIDRAGNIITKQDNGLIPYDLYSFAALASANYAAVDTMAQIVGENEFSMLFHKGKNTHTHFSKINEEYLLVTIFGNDIPLSLLRLKIEKVAEIIRDMWV